ncbi:2-C-methyl-D-erythritol 4-phosphate cytidylyltransferase [Mucilaginibacter aquatilis]|uniref:2-C-methyl-D-erythritol 4-phosphate cytidylyltransferase n=1 Tax=Mucilaginibacter aquatilis TaxID=1517760 RepID=A0A6I4I7Y8_9SPHI|nr:2-C-methyl-D-erythritol 4-phosphate cytidylyltransferase [Mucilaginibacter aquatilis]MVN89579.1 2-C-methyl-D-erythritol 4-phosphate cytidylyltransferase [Mucilaginibacter aquatilis]
MLHAAPHTTHNLHHTVQKSYAIIVAGGSGTRMQSAVPKQFLPVNGLPVLMHTLLAFRKSQYTPNLIVVLPDSHHDYWAQLCSQHAFTIPHELVSGGPTRFHSVKNGLKLVPDDALVAVHDAVRPLTAPSIIDAAYKQAGIQGAVVVAVKSRDSVRQVKGPFTQSLVRDEIYLVQTPQTFKASLLKASYEHPYHENFTDDASVAEHAGHTVHIVEGSYQNFKITFPEDIAIAELLLKQ